VGDNRIKAPFKVDFKTALLIQKLYDFLFSYNVRRKNKDTGEIEHINSIYKTLYIPYDFDIADKDITQYINNGQPLHYLKTGNGKSFNIVEYDILSPYNQTINFEYKNYLNTVSENEVSTDPDELDNIAEGNVEGTVEKEEKYTPYKTIEYLYQLESLIDYYFFNNNMRNNYFQDKIKPFGNTPKNLINLVYLSRNSFYEWFRKGNQQSIKQIIENLSKDIIIENLKNPNIKRSQIINLLNLRLSLLQYFDIGGYNMPNKIEELQEKFKTNLESIKEINSADEYFYLAGQTIYYLLSKSKSKIKTQQMINPVLTCNSIKDLKNNIIELYKKYNYAIPLYDTRFNTVYTLILGYTGEESVTEYTDILIASILSKNLFYIKKIKKEKVGNVK
jgi:CRISPR-associated protein Csh1